VTLVDVPSSTDLEPQRSGAPLRFPRLRAEAVQVADEALGREHRHDPVLGRNGGPAGNARLTAWTGLTLLGLIAAELVTLLDVRGLIDWHVVIGVLLVPVALLKTATTGWRFLRYYRRSQPYRSAGPPPLPLRVLGPLVVLATLGVLASGIVLVLVGESRGRSPLVTVFGQPVDLVTIHQALFVVFAVVAGLHLLARLVPALALTTARVRRRVGSPDAVPGARARAAVVVATLAAAAVAAALLLPLASSWQGGQGPGPAAHPAGITTRP
jgi:hypothetical protein